LCARGGNGDSHEIHCPRNYDRRATHVSTRFGAIWKPGHCIDAGASVPKDDTWNVATRVKKHVASHKQKKHMANNRQRHHAKAKAQTWLWHSICPGS